MDLELVRRWYPIGTELVVHIAGGRSAVGALSAVDSDSLVLSTDAGPTLLLASVIEQVEPAHRKPATTPTALPAALLTEEWAALATELAPVADSAGLGAPIFRRDPAVALTGDDIATVERELVRAGSQYAYAGKVREPERLRRTIRLLLDLAKRRYLPAYHLAALLILEAEPGPSAVQQAQIWLGESVVLGGRYARDAAAVLVQTGQRGEAAAVLARALARHPAERTDDETLRMYVGLVDGAAGLLAARTVLARATDGSPGKRRSAVRAGLHLLRRFKPDRAAGLEWLLRSAEPKVADLEEVLRALGDGTSAASGSVGVMTDAPPVRTPARPTPTVATARRSDAPPVAAGTDSDPQLYVLASRGQLRRGRFAEALEIARKGLLVHPDHAELTALAAETARHVVAEAPKQPSSVTAGGVPRRLARRSGQEGLFAQAQHAETAQRRSTG